MSCQNANNCTADCTDGKLITDTKRNRNEKGVYICTEQRHRYTLYAYFQGANEIHQDRATIVCVRCPVYSCFFDPFINTIITLRYYQMPV